MKALSFLNPPPLFVEIGQVSLKAARENAAVELPLERQPDGRLTAASKEHLVTALRKFVSARSWQPRAKAFCAIGARGVSLRRLSLPGGPGDEFRQRLLLQIEAEFPLPPDELAWGWQTLGGSQTNGVAGKHDLLVAAVKKEIVADYREVLRASGVDPLFTLAALARAKLSGTRMDSGAMADIGRGHAEVAVFEKGVPLTARVIFWDVADGKAATEAVARAAGDCAKLFFTGEPISEAHFAGRCERLPFSGGSAAIAGLKMFAGQGGQPPLLLQAEQTGGAAASLADLDWKKWGARIGALLAAALLLPYAEAILLKPHLEKKVAAFKNESARLKVIDRELEFLRELKLSQPPYLETVSLLSKSVPPGTHFDSLALNSHGEMSLRCAFRDGQQVADFRTKLIASGFFTNVVVEEQSPTPDHQRVNVRLTAQQKPLPQLQALAASLPAEEVKTNAPAAPGGTTPLVTPPASPVVRKDGK